MENCEAMTSSPHSFAYSYRLVKKCFLKICETSKCHNFLIFQPIFIRFSLLCLKIFTLSSEIKLNLLWSSSLQGTRFKKNFCYFYFLNVSKFCTTFTDDIQIVVIHSRGLYIQYYEYKCCAIAVYFVFTINVRFQRNVFITAV